MTMIQTFKTLQNNVLGCLDTFSGKLKIQACSLTLRHLSSYKNHPSLCYLLLTHKKAHKPRAARPASSQSPRGARQSRGGMPRALHKRAFARGGKRRSVFSPASANRFRVTKSDHTSIWKLYFLTWATFWKIDSDVWNWFRTVVRNVRYKWKKLVFNVFSSQLFLLNKYASWGVRGLVGKYGGEVWCDGGYFLGPKIHAILQCISNA